MYLFYIVSDELVKEKMSKMVYWLENRNILH